MFPACCRGWSVQEPPSAEQPGPWDSHHPLLLRVGLFSLSSGNQCLVHFHHFCGVNKVVLLVNGRYLLNVLPSFTCDTEMWLFCGRCWVWGHLCAELWIPKQLVGVLGIVHLCSFAATFSCQTSSVHRAGGDWLACPWSLS